MRWNLIAPGLVIVIAVAFILHELFPPGPSLNAPPPAYLITAFDELGVRVANQTAMTAGRTGSVVIVNVDDVHNETPPMLCTLQQTFYSRMAEIPGLRVVARVPEHTDFTAIIHDIAPRQAIPAARFLALLNEYHDAGVLVLLGATPMLNPEDYARLPAHRPKVVAVDVLGQLPQKRLFAEGVLQAAFVQRRRPTANSAATPAEFVDKLFILYTPENAASIPPY